METILPRLSNNHYVSDVDDDDYDDDDDDNLPDLPVEARLPVHVNYMMSMLLMTMRTTTTTTITMMLFMMRRWSQLFENNGELCNFHI